MEVLSHGILHLLKPDILELLVGFAVLVTILVLAGLVFQKISSARDARRFPPPGQMVDVGGHRLHICRTGKGSPTVVMDSGFPGCVSPKPRPRRKMVPFLLCLELKRAPGLSQELL